MSFIISIGYKYLLRITNSHLRFMNDSISLHFAYLNIFDFFLRNKNFFIRKVNFIESFKICYLKIFKDSCLLKVPNLVKNTDYC